TAPPPPQASTQFSDQQLLYHIMDQNVANHREDVTLYEAMYQMSLNQSVMEPSLFHAHIAWPGDMPHFGDGAGTSAGADDDVADAAAAAAFIDEDEEATQSGDDDEM
ncbi:hypothetical protein A2U01_0067543, partial [Trifolium medium]|nr:hypothetical protein [Trifolium medium]